MSQMTLHHTGHHAVAPAADSPRGDLQRVALLLMLFANAALAIMLLAPAPADAPGTTPQWGANVELTLVQ